MVVPVANKVMELFTSGEYDEVKIVYNQFINAAVQDLTAEQYLPVLPDTSEAEKQNNIDYILEPSRECIIRELIPKSLKIQLFKACLDSIAAEHGARMTAMHKATDNATDLIKSLQLDYNKARQASITKEILEIVGGAEALKG
jgi:F-type H+-transporting ATPase subunit gamma